MRVLALILVALLASCGGGDPEPDQAAPSVSCPQPADMVGPPVPVALRQCN